MTPQGNELILQTTMLHKAIGWSRNHHASAFTVSTAICARQVHDTIAITHPRPLFLQNITLRGTCNRLLLITNLVANCRHGLMGAGCLAVYGNTSPSIDLAYTVQCNDSSATYTMCMFSCTFNQCSRSRVEKTRETDRSMHSSILKRTPSLSQE